MGGCHREPPTWRSLGPMFCWSLVTETRSSNSVSGADTAFDSQLAVGSSKTEGAALVNLHVILRISF